MYFKSFATIFAEAKAVAIGDGSKVKNTRGGAILGALLTALSAAVSMGWLGLGELYSTFYVGLAKGDYLKRRVQDLGMVVNPGAFAAGSLLVSAGIGTQVPTPLAVGTLLSAPNGAIFTTLAAASVTGSNTVVSIQATSVGTAGNLVAGTVLTAINYTGPALVFVVGSSAPGGVATGDMAGGIEPESDDDIKARFPKYLKNLARCTNAALTNALLTTPGISNLVLQSGVPGPGQVTIYTSSTTATIPQNVKDAVAATMLAYGAAGIAYQLLPLLQTSVNIVVNAVCSDTTMSPATVQSQVSTAIRALTTNPKAGRSITNELIISAGYNRTFLSGFQVLSGATIATSSQILVISTVTVNVTYGQ